MSIIIIIIINTNKTQSNTTVRWNSHEKQNWAELWQPKFQRANAIDDLFNAERRTTQPRIHKHCNPTREQTSYLYNLFCSFSTISYKIKNIYIKAINVTWKTHKISATHSFDRSDSEPALVIWNAVNTWQREIETRRCRGTSAERSNGRSDALLLLWAVSRAACWRSIGPSELTQSTDSPPPGKKGLLFFRFGLLILCVNYDWELIATLTGTDPPPRNGREERMKYTRLLLLRPKTASSSFFKWKQIKHRAWIRPQDGRMTRHEPKGKQLGKESNQPVFVR